MGFLEDLGNAETGLERAWIVAVWAFFGTLALLLAAGIVVPLALLAVEAARYFF